MNEPSERIRRYALGGGVILSFLITLGWFAFRQQPRPLDQQPVKPKTVTPVTQRDANGFEPADDSTNIGIAVMSDVSATPNAADLYRQAFALYDALSDDERSLLDHWSTNVDAAVESELCGKIRPICDLMHQTAGLTNCDWGNSEMALDTFMPPVITPSRSIAHATMWSVTHCRFNDAAGATDDITAILRLGRQISQVSMIGGFEDVRLQELVTSYIAKDIGLFRGADAERLATTLRDSGYDDAPIRALQAEAEMADRRASEIMVKSANAMYVNDDHGSVVDQPPFVEQQQQVSDLQLELANALATSSDEDYQAWQQHAMALEAANPLAQRIVASDETFMDSVQRAEVTRAMVAAALVVAQDGENALPSYPDPPTGKPFTYTETANGFELQSSFQVNGKPMTMQFK
jgi:hypothetical protein